jgi:hypothetical protein
LNRKALIISNPGEPGAENYCAGVLKDVVNYQSFLTSPIGGLWYSSEISSLNRPSAAEVRSKVTELASSDYALVVFCGHGWHSTGVGSTCIVLRQGQEIDSTELRVASRSQTLVLDCCRKKGPWIPTVRALDERLAKALPRINPDDCRRYYDKRLEECDGGLVVMYACSIGEFANDDSEKGGLYSFNLLNGSKGWARNSTVDTSSKGDILSVVGAHEQAAALIRESGGRQVPQIEKPRTSPYFPFCIVA